RGMKLFMNVFPETLLNAEAVEFINQQQPKNNNLIFELSGSNRASDAEELVGILAGLKEKGRKICIDASMFLVEQRLSTLFELKPDYIKLNMMSFKGMNTDN